MKNEKAEKDVTKVLELFHSSLRDKNLEIISNLLTDDGLFCGTDSKEIWDKTEILNEQKVMFENPDFKMVYDLTKRIVKVSKEGKSALAIEHFIYPGIFGQNLPVRGTSHLILSSNGWKIDFLSYGLIPDNEDLGKLIKSLAE